MAATRLPPAYSGPVASAHSAASSSSEAAGSGGGFMSMLSQMLDGTRGAESVNSSAGASAPSSPSSGEDTAGQVANVGFGGNRPSGGFKSKASSRSDSSAAAAAAAAMGVPYPSATGPAIAADPAPGSQSGDRAAAGGLSAQAVAGSSARPSGALAGMEAMLGAGAGSADGVAAAIGSVWAGAPGLDGVAVVGDGAGGPGAVSGAAKDGTAALDPQGNATAAASAGAVATGPAVPGNPMPGTAPGAYATVAAAISVGISGATGNPAGAAAAMQADGRAAAASGNSTGNPALDAALNAALNGNADGPASPQIAAQLAAQANVQVNAGMHRFSADVTDQIKTDTQALLTNLLPGLSSFGAHKDDKIGVDGRSGLTAVDAAADAGNSALQPQNLAQMQTHSLANGTPADATSKSIQSPVGSRQWADEVSAHVTWMARQGEQTASLRLNPAHLGPVEVQIAMRNDQTTVMFGAAHADTRAALEQALPRLREMFAAQGMALADAGVSREAPRQQQAQDNGAPGASFNGKDDVSAVSSVTRRISGLLDAYA